MTWIDTDPEGFPEGTYIVNHPPTCTAPADAYVAPACSQWTQEIHFPDFLLAESGAQLPLELALVGITAIVLAAFVLLVVKVKDRRS